MGWPKGKKRESNETAMDVEQQEQETPKEEFMDDNLKCRACGHSEKIHYEGAHKQCNTSGCHCGKLIK